MGFLDNSGDIILDAVLTDTGRMRLAKGDGSFKIVKFALGDDEINYGLYDKNHASGSAYYDLDILQSPVFEAFTNNSISLKSKLLSIPRNNLLYLPTIKINDVVNFAGYQVNIKFDPQVLQPINIVAGVSGLTHKNDQGWKENMSRIAEAHPTSPLADRYGKKSIKQIKTQQALTKNKQRIASRRKK